MHVTSEEGIFTFRRAHRLPAPAYEGIHLVEAEPNEPQVCGAYFITDADKVIQVEVEYMDVSCEFGGLLGVRNYKFINVPENSNKSSPIYDSLSTDGN